MSSRWLTPLLLLFLSGISGIAFASGGLGSSGHKYLPPASFTPSYDLDGNPLDDGEWSYTWDAENRLTTATRTTRAQAAGAPYRRLAYEYDSQSRLYERQEFHGSTGPPLQTERYLYDGWNRILTLNASNLPQQKYLWGSDASSTDQGAGGVSGLLWIKDEGAAQIHLACADGNGNITALVDAVTRATTARYDYNPFGEVIRQTGAYAAQNPFRFSTKPQDATTGLFYYGYRWFDSETCAWLGKDPLGEEGGLNLYLFVGNDPINGIDYLGMLTFGEWTGIIGESFAYMGTGEYWGEVGHNYAQVGKGIKNGAVGAVEGIANLPELAEFVASGEALEMADRLLNDPGYQKEFAERMGAGFCDLLAKLQSNDGAFEASGEVLFGVASGAAVLKALKIAKELKRLLPNRGPISAATRGGGELTGSIRDSFRGGQSQRFILDEDVITYRASDYVPSSSRVGDFFGDTKPLSALDAEELYNIKLWGNNAHQLGGYRIKAGTEVHFGPADGGAGQQFYVPNAQGLLGDQIEFLGAESLYRSLPSFR